MRLWSLLLRRQEHNGSAHWCGCLGGWACGRDYGATDAAQRASCPLATSQQDSSSTAGTQRAVAEAQQDVSSSKRRGGEGEGEGKGEGRIDGCRVHEEGGEGGGDEDMQEHEDDDDDIEEDEEGVEEEGLPSSSEDDEDHFVELLVRGKRTRTPNTRFFNANFA